MTDSRTAERRELEEALMASGATPDQADKIAEALEKERGVKSWKSFYVYFKKFNLKEFFDEQIAWAERRRDLRRTGPGLGRVLPTKSRRRKRPSKSLRTQTRLSRSTPRPTSPSRRRGRSAMPITLHPTQEFTAQLLNGMYRKLQRRQGQAKPVRGLYTLEDRANLGEAKQRKRLFNNDFDLIDKSKPLDEDNPNYIANKSPFLFLIALEAMLRTFVKAGSYLVEDPEAGQQDGAKRGQGASRGTPRERAGASSSRGTSRPKAQRRQDYPAGREAGHEYPQEMVEVLPRRPRG